MKALVAGLGSIGRRHLGNLRTLLPDCEIAVWRHARPASGRDQEADDVPQGANYVVYDVADALAFRPDIAVIASPAPFHVPAASRLSEAGVHLFLEKPISDTADGLATLLTTCRERKLALMVGYNLRFSESLRAARQAVVDGRIGQVIGIRAEVGSFLPDWRPSSDYRRVVSARPELGGGAVLELSHEIDYVRWLGGEATAVTAQIANLGGLGIDVEDTAEITLRLASGALAQIHVDMVQRVPHRTCRVIGKLGTLVWDALSNSVRLHEPGKPAVELFEASQPVDRNAMYLAELREFIDCVRSGRSPSITGEDGWRALQIALAAKRSSAEQRTIDLQDAA